MSLTAADDGNSNIKVCGYQYGSEGNVDGKLGHMGTKLVDLWQHDWKPANPAQSQTCRFSAAQEIKFPLFMAQG